MDHKLLESLSLTETYPDHPNSIEICQTHISVVVLVDECVYKLRKPVTTKFLDFSTLELRKADCDREVELNRRLAPDVYLGVVPVCRVENGFKLDAGGEIVEWAVKMRRLPNESTLLEKLWKNEVDATVMVSLAKRLAAFHSSALSLPSMAEYGRADHVMRNALENFDESTPWIGKTVSFDVWEKLAKLTKELGTKLSATIDARADAGFVRDTHGDLHLDHIYWFPKLPPPGDWVIIDCIEFNERFRFADPVADIAFVVMDLGFRGRKDLAIAFANAYFQANGDDVGLELLPFYSSYRSVVRAKVESIQTSNDEGTQSSRLNALMSAKAHWLFALGGLSKPSQRPCLLLIGGLPGSGKSTIARKLSEVAGFTIIRSDEVRKEIAGNIPRDQLYSPEMSDRTYDECLARSERQLFEGRRVIVDANFPTVARRVEFLRKADSLAIPAWFVHCETDPVIARTRIGERKGDVSDANADVYNLLADRWEQNNLSLIPRTLAANTNVSTSNATDKIIDFLKERGFAE